MKVAPKRSPGGDVLVDCTTGITCVASLIVRSGAVFMNPTTANWQASPFTACWMPSGTGIRLPRP
jgi:hypothetical protein